MDKTIKIIRTIAVSNILILGVAGCTSTPAPWTQADDSPWGAKHASEAQSIPSDEMASDTSLNDPVLLADPEPIVMQEPEPMAAPVVIAPVMVEEMLTPEQEVLALDGSGFAVQVYAGKTAESVEKFKASKDLGDLTMVKTDRSGAIVYVLVDIHADRSSANSAATGLESKTGAKPWVRSIAGLQKIVAQ